MYLFMSKMMFLQLPIWMEEHKTEKYQNGSHLKTILESYVLIHVKDAVSMTTYVDGRA